MQVLFDVFDHNDGINFIANNGTVQDMLSNGVLQETTFFRQSKIVEAEKHCIEESSCLLKRTEKKREHFTFITCAHGTRYGHVEVPHIIFIRCGIDTFHCSRNSYYC